MNTKGNIDQVVYIPVTISEIKITKQGIQYTCTLPKDGICQCYEESELRFIEEPEAPKEEKPKVTKKTKQKKEAPKLTAPKRRGRPKKATVEDLLAKVKSQDSIPVNAMDALAESITERGEAI